MIPYYTVASVTWQNYVGSIFQLSLRPKSILINGIDHQFRQNVEILPTILVFTNLDLSSH